MDMSAPRELKLLMDVCILSQKSKDYNIIKDINEEISYIIYFDPSKYLVKDGYNGHGYSLLCNDIATTVIKDGYHIIRNGYYTVGSSTAQRYSCNRCVPYKGRVKHCSSKTFRSKSFCNEAKKTCGPQGKKMSRRTITQRSTNNKCKCPLFFAIKYDSFGFYLAPKVGNQFHSDYPNLSKEHITFPSRLLNNETKAILDKISKADGNHNIAANDVFPHNWCNAFKEQYSLP